MGLPLVATTGFARSLLVHDEDPPELHVRDARPFWRPRQLTDLLAVHNQPVGASSGIDHVETVRPIPARVDGR